MDADCVLVAIGRRANTANVGLENIGVLTERGAIVTDERMKTNIPGVWAADTCAGVSVHTIITAGDGAKVAINIISELNGERYVDHDILK